MLLISTDVVDLIEMSLGQTLRKSYRELQRSWTQLADSAFGKSIHGTRDEAARGEFISAYICEAGIDRPAATRPEISSR
jgi:hypothetical protein